MSSQKSTVLIAIVCGAAATLSGVGLARFAYSALLPALILQEWFTETQAAFLGAANLVGYMIGAVFASKMCRWWGGQRLLRFSSAIVFISFVGSAWPHDIYLCFIWRFASGVAGGVLMATAPAIMLAQVPVEKKRWASAFIFVGIGLGILVSAVITEFFATNALKSAWFILAGIAFLPFFILQFLWKGDQAAPNGQTQRHNRDEKFPTKTRNIFVVLFFVYAMDAIGYIPHTVFWVDYLSRHANYSLSESSMQWGVFGVGAILGPFLIGLLANRIGWYYTLLVSIAIKGFGILLPLTSHSPVVISSSSILVGAMVPGIVAAMSGRIGELVGTSQRIKAWGIATATFACAQGFAAYFFAFIYTQPGGSFWSFAIGSTCLFLALFILVLHGTLGLMYNHYKKSRFQLSIKLSCRVKSRS